MPSVVEQPWKRACHLMLAATIIVSAPALALAETSSWSWQATTKGSDPATKNKKQVPVTKAKPRNKAAKPSKAFSRQGGGTSGQGTLGGKPQPLPTGDDAAYAAFDQGKYLTALKLAEEAAKKGDPAAHTLIGRIYAEGHGVAPSPVVAAQWYKRGAELGDINAMFAIGLVLAEGRGVEKNIDAAASMFEKAAMTGHPEANYNLGMLFLNGSGKPENPHRAAKHLTYAAEKGVAAAQYDLAALYQKGTGVEPDAYEAARWLSAAAEQGMAAAQYDYAVLLLRGQGLRKDEYKAIKLMQAAAQNGVVGAQNRMAHIYLEGIGVEKNEVEMAKWRLIAKAGGFEDAGMDNRVGKLPAATRQAAEKAAAEWSERSQIKLLQ